MPLSDPQIPAATPPDAAGPGQPARGRAARIGLRALALGGAGFLLWAAFAPLDEGVPSQGIVALDTKRKVVQHPGGGVVKRVLVREGDEVAAGQTLVELDETVERAGHETVRQRYLMLRAIQSRLLAEQAGAAAIGWHADLTRDPADAHIRAQIETQKQLFFARRAALSADLAAIEESVQGQQAMLQAFHGMLEQRRSQLDLLHDELVQTRELVAEGYAPRNRQRELERSVAESRSTIAELAGNIARAQRAIAEQRQRMLQRRSEYRKEVETQLAEVTRDAQSDAEKLVVSSAELDRTRIKAPAAGQVLGLAVQTAGAVVQPGQRLLDIVPADEPLLLEARIDPHLIDRIRPGLTTDVRFVNFAHEPQLVVPGEVISVSRDLLTEQQGGVVLSYYLARVRITPQGLARLGRRSLQPGMPVELVVKTGERTLLSYLWHPLSRRLAAAMKEE